MDMKPQKPAIDCQLGVLYLRRVGMGNGTVHLGDEIGKVEGFDH